MMRDQKGIKGSLTSPKVEIFNLSCWKRLFHLTLFPKSASRIQLNRLLNCLTLKTFPFPFVYIATF